MPIGLPLPVPDVNYGWPDCIGRSQRTLYRLRLPDMRASKVIPMVMWPLTP